MSSFSFSRHMDRLEKERRKRRIGETEICIGVLCDVSSPLHSLAEEDDGDVVSL